MSPNLIDLLAAQIGKKEAAADSSAFQPERRKRTRTGVHWPVQLIMQGAKSISTVTQNLSSSGFYCLSPVPVTPGELLTCILILPAHDPRSEERSVALECRASVVRAEATADGSFGIACRIEDYHLALNSVSVT